MAWKRISIRLDDELHNALKYIVMEDNTSLQDMFLNSVKENYSKRIEEKIKK